jgi:hypothetical protein
VSSLDDPYKERESQGSKGGGQRVNVKNSNSVCGVCG